MTPWERGANFEHGIVWNDLILPISSRGTRKKFLFKCAELLTKTVIVPSNNKWTKIISFFPNWTLSRWVIGKWKRRKWCRKKSGKVGEENLTSVNSYVKREHTKPDLGNFTLEEYTEKIIIYGYLVVSSVLYWQYFSYLWQDPQDLAIILLNRQPEMLSWLNILKDWK